MVFASASSIQSDIFCSVLMVGGLRRCDNVRSISMMDVNSHQIRYSDYPPHHLHHYPLVYLYLYTSLYLFPFCWAVAPPYQPIFRDVIESDASYHLLQEPKQAMGAEPGAAKQLLIAFLSFLEPDDDN